jgi:hypothetical protein
MKGRPKITKFQLDDQKNEIYAFLGIVSAEADYKLSYLLNNKLKITLKNTKSLEVAGGNGSNLIFSRYSDTTGAPEIMYNLISNRSDKDYLLKKLKNIDYLFQVHSYGNRCNIELLTDSLREIEMITAVFRLDPEEIKDKNLYYLTL